MRCVVPAFSHSPMLASVLTDVLQFSRMFPERVQAPRLTPADCWLLSPGSRRMSSNAVQDACYLKQQGYAVTYVQFNGGHEVPATVASSAIQWFQGSFQQTFPQGICGV